MICGLDDGGVMVQLFNGTGASAMQTVFVIVIFDIVVEMNGVDRSVDVINGR